MVGRGAAAAAVGEKWCDGVEGGAVAEDPDGSVVQGPKAILEGAGDAN